MKNGCWVEQIKFRHIFKYVIKVTNQYYDICEEIIRPIRLEA